MVIKEGKKYIYIIFIFFQNLKIYAYFGGFGWGGGGSPSGESPQKSSLYYYQSHISFLFHFGDESSIICIIDYWLLVGNTVVVQLWLCGIVLVSLHNAQSVVLLSTYINFCSGGRRVLPCEKYGKQNYFMAQTLLEFGKGASGSIWWLLLFLPKRLFPWTFCPEFAFVVLPCFFLDFRVFLGLNPHGIIIGSNCSTSSSITPDGLGNSFLHFALCVGTRTRGWTLKSASNHIKKTIIWSKQWISIFWPNEVMESHKVLHIGTISTPMFRKRHLHPPSPAPLYYWYH